MPAIPRLSVREGLARYRSDRLALLRDLGETKTPIVESVFGPIRLIVVTDSELCRELLVKNAKKLKKGPAISRYAAPILGDGLLSSEGESHKRQRKILSPKFQPRHMARYAADMIGETRAMLGRWKAGKHSEDFSTEMIELTMAIAAQTMFGTNIDDVVATVSEALDTGNRYIIDEAVSLVHLPLSLPTPRNLAMQRSLEKLDEVIYQMIRQHRERPDDPGDVLSVLLDARDEDDGSGLSDELVRDEVVTFFLAGHETTANALAWAYPLLCDNPNVVTKLQAEVAEVLGDREPTFEDVARMPYTANVFKEVTRLYPPSYMIGRQACESFELGGYSVKKGAYVLVNSFGSHRRSDYFPDPEAFQPERFANEGGRPKLSYVAFGAGPRVCIGTHFAMLEGVLILAMLAQNIDFVDSGFDYQSEALITLRPKNGVPFTLKWREQV